MLGVLVFVGCELVGLFTVVGFFVGDGPGVLVLVGVRVLLAVAVGPTVFVLVGDILGLGVSVAVGSPLPGVDEGPPRTGEGFSPLPDFGVNVSLAVAVAVAVLVAVAVFVGVGDAVGVFSVPGSAPECAGTLMRIGNSVCADTAT